MKEVARVRRGVVRWFAGGVGFDGRGGEGWGEKSGSWDVWS